MSEPRELSVMWIEDQMEDLTDGLPVVQDQLRDQRFHINEDGSWTAKTVEEAEDKLTACEESEVKPDVILLDLMLPMDQEDADRERVDLDAGYLLWFEIRKMRKWPSLVEVPILIITARGRPEYKEQVTAPGERTLWRSKPASPADVAKSIATLLEPSCPEEQKRDGPRA